jgi:hypothetical protein
VTNGVDDHLVDKVVKNFGNSKLIDEIRCALCQITNKSLAYAARQMSEDSPIAPVAAANAHDQSCGSALLRFEIAGSNSLITGRVDGVNFLLGQLSIPLLLRGKVIARARPNKLRKPQNSVGYFCVI